MKIIEASDEDSPQIKSVTKRGVASRSFVALYLQA